MTAPAEAPVKCLDRHKGACEGEVEYHHNPYSSSLKAWPRCDKHYTAYVEYMAGVSQRYPDTPNPPPGFDPSYAGETWNDDY